MSDYVDKSLKTRLILPFATCAADRLKDFTKDMEMAAILYLAESNRRKGEGYILKKADEKLVFVTEACYPIWLIPHDGATLVFDGLGLASHSFSYDAVPDVEIFNKNIGENRKAAEDYTVTLEGNADFFGNFGGREEKTVEGLIAAPELLNDFMTYISQMKETEKPFTKHAFLTLTTDDYEIQVSVEELSNLRKRTSKDIQNIDASLKLLKTTTAANVKAIRKQIRRIQGTYDRQIEKIKPKVARKILQIQGLYRRRIAKSSRRFNRRLQSFHKNRVRLQKTLRHLRSEAKQCEARMQSSRRRKRKRVATQWSLRLERIRKKLPNLKRQIEGVIKKTQEIEASQKLLFARQKAECAARIEAVDKVFRELQASKEVAITAKRQELEAIKTNTFGIANQMNEMSKAKKMTLKEFEAITMPRRERESELVYVPFYLVRYEAEGKGRYMVYPPSLVSDMGTLTRMKGALGAVKMKALLKSRSEAMTTFLNRFVTFLEENPVLEKEVTEAGIQNSVLLTKQLRIGVKKGLEELQNENWISKDELEAFGRLLYIYV